MNQPAARREGVGSDFARAPASGRSAEAGEITYVVSSSVKKYATLAAAWGFTCVAITWALLFLDQPQENRDAAPWVLLVWWSVEALFVARLIWRSQLVIDGEGFTYSRFWRRRHVAWSECAGFGVVRPAKALPMVVVTRRLPSGRESQVVLPENYGLAADRLANVLADFRARAAGRA